MVTTSSGYEPGRAVWLILTSTKRYVPLWLTNTLEVCVAKSNERTRAPTRFLPCTRSRTGLIVCLAHQEGGSTLITDGPSALVEANVAKPPISKQPTKLVTLNRVSRTRTLVGLK